MCKTVLVSVIIPVYNTEKFLRTCLDSVINQSMKDIEIICVDDGSTDSSIEILKEYEKKDSRVKILCQKNLHAGVARNAGMEVATGKYFVFLDSDDFFEPTMLEKEYQKCEEAGADICLCAADKYDTVSGEFQPAPWLLNLEQVAKSPFNSLVIDDIFGVTAPNPWTKMFSAQFVKRNKLQFQNLQRANDCYFVLSALALADKIVAVDEVLVHYRVGQETNLQATLYQTPSIFLEALLAVKEKLCKEKLYDRVEQSFLHAALKQIQYNVSRHSSDELSRKELLKDLKEFYLEKLGFEKYCPNLYGGGKEYSYVMKALENVHSTQKTVLNEDNPKISILIPIYNTSAYLQECLESVINQTLTNIEIICVNDGSTDNSLDILNEYAEKDRRIKVINQKNSGLYITRKVAVSFCTGQFIMFLDSDDYLETTACEELYEVICSKEVDIVQFGTYVEAALDVDKARTENLAKLLRPYPKVIYGSILEAGFIEKKFRFSIWNKIYKSKIVKKAYEQLPDDTIFKAEDLYAFLAIAFYAKSYYGIKNKYYHYRFGYGITGKSSIGKDTFEVICKQSIVALRIKEFLEKQRVFDRYEDIYTSIYTDLLSEVINNWHCYLEPSYKKEAIQMIVEQWDALNVLKVLVNRFKNAPYELAELLEDSFVFPNNYKEKIQKIGIFYHHLTMGGVQRVISLLMPIYIELGYKIVLFTDKIATDEEYSIPDEVQRVIIPEIKDMKTREEQLYGLLSLHKVDVFIHHATSSQALLFDILAAKLQGIPVVINIHEVFSAQIHRLGINAAHKYKIYRLADIALTLSKVQETYWRTLGVNAKKILNPLTYDYDVNYKPNLRTHNIIWVGRIGDDKNCEDAIKIFAKVKKVFDDSKLIVLGDAISITEREKIYNIAKALDVYEQIEFVGYTETVDDYYKRASVYLMTSLLESFSMTLAESKMFGLPAVIYNLPYIDFAAKDYGTITVPQCDVGQASSAIIKLFSDPKYMEEQSKLSFDCAKMLAEYDLKAAWQDIFSEIANKENKEVEPELGNDLRISIETLLFSYSLACQKHVELKKRFDKELKKNTELQEQLQKMDESRSCILKGKKILNKLFYVPRKVFGGIQCCRDHGLIYTLNLAKKKLNIS